MRNRTTKKLHRPINKEKLNKIQSSLEEYKCQQEINNNKKESKKSDQIKYKKLEIYCLCKNNKKKGSMVLCRKESDCISFKERLKI